MNMKNTLKYLPEPKASNFLKFASNFQDLYWTSLPTQTLMKSFNLFGDAQQFFQRRLKSTEFLSSRLQCSHYISNKARIPNAVQCHNLLSGYKDCQVLNCQYSVSQMSQAPMKNQALLSTWSTCQYHAVLGGGAGLGWVVKFTSPLWRGASSATSSATPQVALPN